MYVEVTPGFEMVKHADEAGASDLEVSTFLLDGADPFQGIVNGATLRVFVEPCRRELDSTTRQR